MVVKLDVLWSGIKIGTLLHMGRNEPYYFWYCDLAEATRAGFRYLPEFQHKHHAYKSPYLFLVFRDRIPNPKRGDYNQMMSDWGVQDPTDCMEILMKSEGRKLTDLITLRLPQFTP